MNLNTFSLMATAPIVTLEDSRFQRFPKPSYLGYTFFFLLKCWKVFTGTIFHRSFTTTNKKCEREEST